MAMKLYVGGLSYNTTDEELQALFAPHGTVTSANIIKDRDTGQSKGFGFVELDNDDGARAAIKELDGKEIAGRPLKVSQARPQEKRSGGFGQR